MDSHRSVSYCNKTCQTADYKRGHKRECQEFLHPPFVSDFIPTPIGDMKYDRNPIFAWGHTDGIGCWVSISGRADAEYVLPASRGSWCLTICWELTHIIGVGSLRSFAEHIHVPDKPGDITLRNEMISRDLELVARTRAYDVNLLTLHVLVQSRRKDGAAVAVFPAQTMLESRSLPESIATLMNGKAEGDRITTYQLEKCVRARFSFTTCQLRNGLLQWRRVRDAGCRA